MKTAMIEHLFNKYKFNYWENHGFVMNLLGFTKALTEHDSEIKELIAEMIEEHRKRLKEESGRGGIWRQAKIEALTELKERLDK